MRGGIVKNTIKVILSAVCLLGVVAVGCNVNDPQKPAPQEPDPFPNTVGSWWVYERVDSLTMVTDTLTITVSDTTPPFLPEDARIWTLSSSKFGELNSIRVSIANDTISVRREDGVLRSEQFVLPFDSGLTWRGIVGKQRDSSEVFHMDSVDTPAETFLDIAIINRTWSSGFEGENGATMTHIVENVGIVKRQETYFLNDGGGLRLAISDEWILLNYLIK